MDIKSFMLRVFTCDAWLFHIYSYNKEWITFSSVVCTIFMQPDEIVLKFLLFFKEKKITSAVIWHICHSFTTAGKGYQAYFSWFGMVFDVIYDYI